MISVIIPVYKVEKYLNRCVDSVLGQTYQDFEIILVEDGSPDNCGAICDAYAAKDPRIHVIHQQNAGVSAARNAGIEYALNNSDSKWIAFVDSDDWLHRQYLECLVEAVEKTGAKLSLCDRVWVSEYRNDVQIQKTFHLLESEDAFVQYYPNCTPPWGKLIEKSLLQDLRFPVGIRYEDAYITHILTFMAEKVAVCPEKLYYYFNNSGSYTRTGWTDGRMDSITVHEKRLEYFRDKGYNKAYDVELEEYIERVTSHLSELSDIRTINERNAANFDLLRKKLKAAVREGEARNVCRMDRAHIMTYAYLSSADILWKTLRAMQKCWHYLHRR